MRPSLPLIAALALGVPGSPHAQQIYKCEIDGRTTYSDQPCSDDASRMQAIVVDPPAPARTDPSGSERESSPADDATLTPYQQNMQAMQRANRLHEFERACIARLAGQAAQHRAGGSARPPPEPRAAQRTAYPPSVLYAEGVAGKTYREDHDREWAQLRQREIEARQRYDAEQRARGDHALAEARRACAMQRRAEENRIDAGAKQGPADGSG